MCCEMAAATAAPPATASEPPSQKSFCTSTTISALVMSALQIDRRDRGLAARKLEALPRHAHQCGAQPFAALLQRGEVGRGLSSAHQRDLHELVVRAELRFGGRLEHDLLQRRTGVLVPPQRLLPAATRLLGRAALLDVPADRKSVRVGKECGWRRARRQ